MPLLLGEAISDFTFLQADGAPLPLQAFRGKTLLLVFLRHLD